MADQNPSTGQQAPEKALTAPESPQTPELMPYPEVQAEVRRLDYAAEHVPQTLDIEAMMELESAKSPEVQVEGLAPLQSRLINLLVRIRKANPTIDLATIKPAELLQVALTHGVKIEPHENMAWQKYMELTARPGLTSSYLAKSWKGEGGIVRQAQDATDGWGEKLKRSFHENPVRTTMYAAAGVAVVYLGWQLIKKLWSSDEKEEEDKEEEKDKKKKKGGFLGLLQSHGKTMGPLAIIAAGLFLGRDGLRRMLMDMGKEELDELMQKGEALPAKVREEIEQQRKEIEALRSQVEGKAQAAQSQAAGIAQGARETLQDPSLKRVVTAKALVGIYALSQPEWTDTFKNDIGAALTALRQRRVSDILFAYQNGHKEGKINGRVFDFVFSNEEALFHACQLVQKLRDYYQKRHPAFSVDEAFLGDFLDHLGDDPTYALHQEFTQRMNELGLDALTDPAKVGRIFDVNVMKEVVEENRDRYIDRLATRFGVTTPLEDKVDFYKAMGVMLADANIEWSREQLAEHLHVSPGAEAAALRFFENLQAYTREQLPRVVEQYDIERSDQEAYNFLLKKHLKPEALTFTHALELALVLEGVQLQDDRKPDPLDQAKDIAVLMVISNMLKPIDEDAQVKYLTNVVDVLSGNIHGFNLNTRWQALRPYLAFFGRQTLKQVERKAKHTAQTVFGLSLPSDAPDFKEQIQKADWLEFPLMLGKEAGVGALRIPKELALTLYENGKDFNEASDGNTVLKLILAAGGVLFYSKGSDGENLGVAYLFGKYFFLKPMETGWDTLTQAFSGAAVKTYVVESAPYIAIGASVAALKAHGHAGHKAAAFLRGAIRGAMAPVTMPIAGYRALRTGYWNVERMAHLTQMKFNTALDVPLLQRSADMFEAYWNKVRGASVSALDTAEALVKEPIRQGKMMIYQDIYQGYARRWGDLFIRDYYHFFDVNPLEKGGLKGLEDIQLKTEHPELNAALECARRMRRMTEALQQIPNLEGMKADEFIEHLKRMADQDILKHGEFAILEKKALDPRGFARLKRMILKTKVSSIPASMTERLRISDDLFKGSRQELADNLRQLQNEVKTMPEGPEKVIKLRQIHALRGYLNPEVATALSGKALADYERLPAELKAERLKHFATEAECRSFGVNAWTRQQIEAIQETAKREGKSLAHPDIQKRFLKLDQKIEHFAKSRADELNWLSKEYKKLPRRFRGGVLKGQVKAAIRGPSESLVMRIKSAGAMRLKLGVLVTAALFSVEALTKDPEQEWHELLEEFGPTAAQIMVDILPFIGTGSLLWGAITGTQTIDSKHDLDTTQRIMNAAFGVASLAGDALTVAGTVFGAGIGGVAVGSATMAARLSVIAAKGGKMGKAANVMLKSWPRISNLMGRMGIRKFAESTAKFVKGERAIKNVKRVERFAMAGGMGVMAGSLVYSFAGGHEIEVPEDIEMTSATPEAESAEEATDIPEAA